MLEARIRKHRAQFTVDVAIAVASGSACGLFGASGAGKSTILACIAGAELPDDGSVVLDELVLFPPPLPLHRRPIGYLTQDANLFPHLRVADNVRFVLSNGARAQGEAWIAQLRERLQLAAIWEAPAHAISGGQARRVALARMLARKPRLVLLDEPFAGLDRHLVRELLAAIVEWQRELGFTMLVVDHEAAVLERICPRVIVVEHGAIVQDAGWPELKAAPATPLLAQLLAPL
ncbi:MAG TPA: ATP-binding cassette domain-containing protein [Candidatus Acidoferrales bacterium]|nr:ATP-binding cassette domain-containing protein [Candidatus Acidoferrales bacterium]